MSHKEYFRHSAKVIKDRRWPALRLQALRRDNFECVDCGSKHHLQIDHVKSVRDAPELAFDLENLATRCRVCHSRKTRLEVFGPLSPEREAWRDLVLQT